MEAKCEFSKLTIPNDHSYVKVAVSYADAIARKIGFSEKERADIGRRIERSNHQDYGLRFRTA